MATVLLLVGLSGCTADEPSDTPSASPTSASPSPSTTPTYMPKASLDDLPTGPPPRIAYADDEVIVHPDGTRERLIGQKRIGLTAFARYRDGWLVADGRIFEGTVGLAYVAGRNREDIRACASGGAILSSDGERAAWTTQHCPESAMPPTPTLIHVGAVNGTAEEQREIERTGVTFVHGFVDDEVVVSGFTGGVQLVGPTGDEHTLPRLDTATAVGGQRGLVAGTLKNGYSHAALVDARAGRVLWHRRHTYLTSFSPDGSLVAGQLRRRPALFDTDTGHVVALVKSFVDLYGEAWEDDEHLLAVATTEGGQTIVRIDLHGNVTRVAPIAHARLGTYLLETRP